MSDSVFNPPGKINYCLHQLFSQQVKQNPHQPAVSYGDLVISYQELDRRANQLAHYLQQLGVEAETIVGLSVERSLETIIGILAILKAGGAYLPLDPVYPAERLTYILENSQAPVIITQSHLQLAYQHQAKVVLLDTDAGTITQQSTEAPPVNVTPENLLSVIYTSGSTGNPKGVMLTHKNIASLFAAVKPKLAFNNQDVWTMFHAYSFGFSVWEIWGALLHGGKLIIVPQHICSAAEEFYALVARQGVTVLSQTPSAFNLFVRADSVGDRNLSLRLIVFSGEALEPYLLKSWLARHGDKQPQLVNMYAMCETAGEVTYKRIQAQEIDQNQRSIIGLPLPHVQIYLLDESQTPVARGSVGEMYVGGQAIARGYLNQPKLTAQKFIRDPFSNLPETRLYRTGDIARYLPDGQLEFIGRGDRQVKIRGFRVELGEIEAILGQQEEIAAVAVKLNDLASRKLLTAYIVVRQPVDIAQLKTAIAQRLPDYAIPDCFICIDSLPLTANGKLDFAALPLPDLERQLFTANSYVAPSNKYELKLSSIWQRILGIKQIGVDDNYFELGGTSVLAARLFTEIEQRLNRTLPLATIFTAPTIAQLAKVLQQENSIASASSLVPLQTKGSKPALFCLHNAGGHTFIYQYLATHLQDERPVYGLQSRGLNGLQADSQIEDMAAHYLEEIRQIQPHGPYYLGGHSLGGIIAWEMAQQLNQMGEKVDFLGLFDCYGINLVHSKNSLPLWFMAHLNNLKQLEGKEKAKYFTSRLNWYAKKIVPRPIVKIYANMLSKFLPTSTLLRRQVEQINRQAAAKYQPQPYFGNVTLFQAQIKLAKGYQDPFGGWKGLALGELEIHQVPGKHQDFLTKETDARIFVDVLRSCLQEGQNIA